jgi:cytochrome c3-like protein/FHA domain-containing protein
MIFRVRTIDQTAAGREIVRERDIAQDTLSIGRAAENDIHLPDLAVEQQHVRVSEALGGQLRLEALGTLGFTVDGRSTTDVTIAPREGAELELGSYRLDFSAAGDGAVTITVRSGPDKQGRQTEAVSGFGLASVLPGKRGVAWLALVAILLAFLAVPIYSHLTRAPAKPTIDRPGTVIMDASWSPGRLSDPHHALETNCEACHVKAFVAVRDNACLACHTDIGDHAAHAKLIAARGPLSWGEGVQRAVADMFHKPGPGACTDCHTEHQGAGRMAPTRQKFCADCHGTLSRQLPDASIGDASDFGTLHPQFAALIETAPSQSRPARVSLDAHPKEWDGLHFPHDLHLDPRGGVARMASRIGSGHGYGVTLKCEDCHHKTADGVRFLPVNMERDCEACHSLVYDKVGSTFRTLRHGNIAQMRADLAAGDRAAHQVPAAGNRRRPGEYAAGGLYYSNFTGGSGALARAMSIGGVCGECHIPTGSGGRLGVMPVLQHSRYFTHGWFSHADHKEEKCASCHAAGTSRNSSDLLLPGISKCRDCHLGEDSRKAKVPSGCAMCHSYHPRQGAPVKPALIAARDHE